MALILNFLVFLLSLIDGLLTIYVVEQSWASEVNPLLAYLLDIHPGFFMLVKLLLTGLCVSYFYRRREFFLARLATKSCLLLYLGIIVWHLYHLCFLLS